MFPANKGRLTSLTPLNTTKITNKKHFFFLLLTLLNNITILVQYSRYIIHFSRFIVRLNTAYVSRNTFLKLFCLHSPNSQTISLWNQDKYRNMFFVGTSKCHRRTNDTLLVSFAILHTNSKQGYQRVK